MLRLALALLGALMLVPATAQQPVRLATEGSYPPFNGREGDRLVGFDVEIGDALCARLRRQCTWTTEDWDRLLPGLVEERYDVVIAAVPISEERGRLVQFSRPYVRLPAGFVGARGVTITAADPDGLADRTIGVEAGSLHDAWLRETVEGDGVTIRRYARLDEAFLDLEADRVDLVFGDRLALDRWLKTPAGGAYAFAGPEIDDAAIFGEGPALAFRPGDDDLRAAFDEALNALIADGSYRAIAARHFPFDVTPRR